MWNELWRALGGKWNKLKVSRKVPIWAETAGRCRAGNDYDPPQEQKEHWMPSDVLVQR